MVDALWQSKLSAARAVRGAPGRERRGSHDEQERAAERIHVCLFAKCGRDREARRIRTRDWSPRYASRFSGDVARSLD
jgi:hypothetical protein